MNKARKIFWTSLVILVAILIVLAFKKGPVSRNDAASVQPTNKGEAGGQAVVKPKNSPSIQANGPTQNDTPTPASSPSLSKEAQKRAAALERNVPIDFFGRVIDQNGNPLAGVNISANTRTIIIGVDDKPYTAFPKTNLVTGASGEFEISGMAGDVLTIESLDKEGYEKDPSTLRGFSYDPSQHFTSSFDNPIIFKLWQNGLKQPLVTGDQVFKFIPDGRLYSIDLLTGTLAEAKDAEGDLQFSLKRPNDAKRRQPYDWSFKVRSKNGSILQESSAEYFDMTVAPAEGYTNIYESNHMASENGWVDGEGHERFFVKMRGGQIYGRILISVNSFYDVNTGQGRLELQYVINPSGSQILR